MEDPLNSSEAQLHEDLPETRVTNDRDFATRQETQLGFAAETPPRFAISQEDIESRRKSFRRTLYLLLSFSLAAFILTTWILVRVAPSFDGFSTEPQDVARAQLVALDHGELRPAYDMFSARYRQQVSFDVWHELCVTHWRMFHAEVLHAGAPSQRGPSTTLEMDLRGADNKDYRARYTLVLLNGRWWIDDVHWAEESNGRNFSRT